MNVTKYAHACLVIEEEGHRLIIDPGSFTDTFGDLSNIQAVVITHGHMDHCNPAHLARIAEANPDVQYFSVADVSKQLAPLKITTVAAGQTVSVGPLKLRFYGDQHALIHESIPRVGNVGVMVNDTLYYPGDSLTLPGVPVAALALPVSAPWLKIGEAIDFLEAVKPQLCFPTHNAILSEQGMAIIDNIIGGRCTQGTIVYHSLKPGQTLVV